MLKLLFYLLTGCIGLLALVFAVLNAQPVTMNYYFGQDTWPLSLLLAVFFLAGGLLGLLFSTFALIKLKKRNKKLQKKIQMIETEVVNLRALPLTDQR